MPLFIRYNFSWLKFKAKCQGFAKLLKWEDLGFQKVWLAFWLAQWVFWAIRNYPKNLCSFYIEPNGEMTAKRTWVYAHVHMCVIYIYIHTKRYFTNIILRNGTLNFSASLKFSLRLWKNNYAVWLKEIWKFSRLLVKCLVFQSIKIKIVLGSEFHECGFYNYKYIKILHRHGIFLTFSLRCFFNKTCQIFLNFPW